MSKSPKNTNAPKRANKTQKSNNALLGLFITLGLIFTFLLLYLYSTGKGLSTATNNQSIAANGDETPTLANQSISEQSGLELTATTPPLVTPQTEETTLPSAWLPALEIANACATELGMSVKLESYASLWKWLPQAMPLISNSAPGTIPPSCKQLSNAYGHHGINDLLALAGGSNWWVGKQKLPPPCNSIEGCAADCSSGIDFQLDSSSYNDFLLLNAYLANTFPDQSSNQQSCSQFQVLLIQNDFDIPSPTAASLAEFCATGLLPQTFCGTNYVSPYAEDCGAFLGITQSNNSELKSQVLDSYAISYGDVANECLEYLSHQFMLDETAAQINADISDAAQCFTTSDCPLYVPLDLTQNDQIFSCVTEMGWESDPGNIPQQNERFIETLLAAPWLNIPLPESCKSVIEQLGLQAYYWTFIAYTSQSQ